MKNVTTSVKGKLLTIVVDLSATGEPSKSGKTTLIATTGGFSPPVVPGISFALNVCKKAA